MPRELYIFPQLSFAIEYFLTIIFVVSIDFKKNRKLAKCEGICVKELIVIKT